MKLCVQLESINALNYSTAETYKYQRTGHQLIPHYINTENIVVACRRQKNYHTSSSHEHTLHPTTEHNATATRCLASLLKVGGRDDHITAILSSNLVS